MVLKQLIIHKPKNEFRHWPFTKMSSEWIMYLNVKFKAINFLEENITEKSTWPWGWWWEIKWNTISMIHEKNVSYLQVSHPQIQPTTDWFDLQIQSLNCIFTEEWNSCMRRCMQFKPMLSKGQLYSIIQILELSGKAKL